MLDKNGILYYSRGLSYMLPKWEQWAAAQDAFSGNQETAQAQRKHDTEAMRRDSGPLVELRTYLLKQVRAVRRDESLLARIAHAADTAADELRIDEKALAAMLLVITSIDRLTTLFNDQWVPRAAHCVQALKAIDKGVNDLRLCAKDLEDTHLRNEKARELLATNDFLSEHDKEMHRILSELMH